MLDLAGIKAVRPLRLHEGAAAARARASEVDGALSSLAGQVLGPDPGVALVAVGGYGRAELSPHSDIDLLFLIPSRAGPPAATLRGLLYPLWDSGWQVGHAVRGPREAIELARSDLYPATALLSARLIAGDQELFGELKERRRRWLVKEGRSLARRIIESSSARHRRVDRAGWSLAPDLKEDRGGLRDVHAVVWALALSGEQEIPEELGPAASTLLAAREALHAEVGRKQDRLRMHLQSPVASRLGFDGEDGADLLMTEVHTAARTIEHVGWRLLGRSLAPLLGGPRRSGSTQVLGPGMVVADGAVDVQGSPSPAPLHGLELLAGVAETGRHPSPKAAEWLQACFAGTADEVWPQGCTDVFLRLLSGRYSSSALEALDHTGGWLCLMPEWLRIRGRPQHDPYHHYTVDGHSFIAVEEIGRIAQEMPSAGDALAGAGDLSPLYLATLLHDVGKGSGEDHSVAGARVAKAVGRRMGLAPAIVEETVTLVRNHLLLVDTATRRDLGDGAVVGMVAASLGTPRLLRLLYVLTIADARATGPEGWSSWKGMLVLDLYRKVLIALETGELPIRSDVRTKAREVEAFEPALAGRVEDVLETLPPSYLDAGTVPEIADDVRLLLSPPRAGEIKLRFEPQSEPGRLAMTLCVPDRPGSLARAAGVLALNRVSVLSAQAYVTSAAYALERFVVTGDAADLSRVEADMAGAFSGRLAIDARLRRKALDYKPMEGVRPDVRVLQDESEHSTVVEVRAPDALGLLYAITSAMADLDLDIHVAKIDTLGPRVVDVFYVRTMWGSKLDQAQAEELTRSINHRIEGFFA